MKKSEILERLKNGDKINYYEWGGFHYSFDNGDRISAGLICDLIRENKVVGFYSKKSPLTGIVKLK